ncbi:hypothetical protein D3C71_2230030 [compost metagenome]
MRARLASSRAVDRVVTMSGRQCFSRENSVPCDPCTNPVCASALSPSAKPTGSTRKVRMMEGYKLL